MDFTVKQEKGLKKLARSLPGFLVLHYFRGLQRSRSYHTVEYLQSIAAQGALEREREDLVPSYQDVLEVVKKLDHLGLGAYVQGRKGNKTRIEWYEGVCLPEIGATAIPDLEEAATELDLRDGARPAGAGDVQSSDVTLDPVTGGWLSQMDTLKHSYQLRPGVFVELVVPQDMTQLEAQRLGAFVGTLSMES